MLTYAKIKAPRAARPATAMEPETELAAPVNAGAYGDLDMSDPNLTTLRIG
jgi:hypothetical protein